MCREWEKYEEMWFKKYFLKKTQNKMNEKIL